MNKKDFLFLSILLIFSGSCTSKKKYKNPAADEITQGFPAEADSPPPRLNDSLTVNSNPVTKETRIKKEDPVSENRALQSPAVKRYLDGLRITWKNTANPIIATYEGNDFGDYHHIIFKDAKGNTYDFGQAANHYGKYQLHDLSGQYKDNAAWLGKRFKVYWDWKLSDFLCCEGEYEKTKAYLPAITKLELIKD